VASAAGGDNVTCAVDQRATLNAGGRNSGE
jgi:hypothetical protein